jgi:hypothetical protein
MAEKSTKESLDKHRSIDLRLLRRDRAVPAITRRDSYRADWTAIAGEHVSRKGFFVL